jgi:hypothetical protein
MMAGWIPVLPGGTRRGRVDVVMPARIRTQIRDAVRLFEKRLIKEGFDTNRLELEPPCGLSLRDEPSISQKIQRMCVIKGVLVLHPSGTPECNKFHTMTGEINQSCPSN